MSKIIDRQLLKHFKGKGHFYRDALSPFFNSQFPPPPGDNLPR